MQPQLTTREGNVIPLTDEMYEEFLQLMEARGDSIEPAGSIEELEAEFAELFADAPSTDDLLAEHAEELAREERKLELFR